MDVTIDGHGRWCNGDLAAGFYWIHRLGGPLMAACPPCADEARAAGFIVDPIRRVSVRPE